MHIQSNSAARGRDLKNFPKLPETGLVLVVRKTFAEVSSAEEALEQPCCRGRARSHDAVFRREQTPEEWSAPLECKIGYLDNMCEDDVLEHNVDADEETSTGSCSASLADDEEVPALTSQPSSQSSSPRTPLTTKARIFIPQPQHVAVPSDQSIPEKWCYYVHMSYPMVQSHCASYGVQGQVPFLSQHCHDSNIATINKMEEEDKKKKSATKRRNRNKTCMIDPNAPEIPATQRTSVMMRNIPYCFKREMLWALLDSQGFNKRYDFVYLPTDFLSEKSLGYAFINFLSHDDALEFFEVFSGFDRWDPMKSNACKPCKVDWGHPYQGFDAHVNRYQNSPVMHHEVATDAKPTIFVDGVPAPFPAPTKKIDKPRWKHNARIGSHKEEICTDN